MFDLERFQRRAKRTMHALGHAVGSWMIRSGRDVLDVENAQQLRDDVGRELAPIVRCNLLRDTEASDDTMEENRGHGGSGDVGDRSEFNPAAEMINHCEHVGMA